MSPFEWIRGKLTAGVSKDALRMMYKVFLKETSSTMKYDSYKRVINRIAKTLPKSNSVASEPGTKIKTEVEGPDTTIVSESHEIRTLEQLLAYCRVDLTTHYVTKHVVNMWGSATNPSFQVKAWLSVIGYEKPTQGEILKNLESIVSNYKPIKFNIKPYKKGNGCLVIDPVDAHIGAMSYNNTETLKDQCAQYTDAVIDILSQAETKNGEFKEIVFNVGHDLIHINADKPETKKGTPQEVNAYPHQICEAVSKMLINIIFELSSHTERVKVICTFGNHDSHNMMWVGTLLNQVFSTYKTIDVDYAFEERKFHKYGCTVFTFTHKPMRQNDKMSVMMFHELKDRGLLTDEVIFYEVMCGHLHEKKRNDYQSETTDQKITQRVLSSISGDHRYSVEKYGHTVKEAQGFFYTEDKGFRQSYCYRVL